jgi:hypothetical protein
VEGAGLDKGRRGNGSRANGTNPRALGTNPRALGTNPRAIENHTLREWRGLQPHVDKVRETASLPPDQRLTWNYVREHVDPLTWKAIEDLGGCALIADRDRFTTKKLEMRFRQSLERLVKREAHA